ncbi:MAG: polysaccharide deacetylase family protein [Ferruginibacter sp.]|nr:polysaccharide deacetylase family protein [Ferruginibacter sp.]
MNNHGTDKGVFVISLDFELLWGVWDVTTKEKYGDHIIGVQQVIPALLHTFEAYDIKATFATVGILFAKDKKALANYIPDKKPRYHNQAYNVYLKEFTAIGNDEQDDPYHFGYSLFELIKKSPHEISTHTFSHYFCLEEGQSADEFDADIKAAVKIAAAENIHICSLVFPRNQINETYLQVLKDNGIKVYRGNPESWIYKPRKFSAEVPFIRLCRLLDTYLPVSGNNTFSINSRQALPVNIPASRFLKPYNKNLAWLEKLKLKRIMNEMTYAAKNRELYHLWWHPHNFGVNIKENMENLSVLLKHYQHLRTKYGFANLTMKEAAGF